MLINIKRRYVVAGLAMLATTAARAAKPPHIGFISGLDLAAASDFIAALRAGLNGYGYTEPATLELDLLFADYQPARVPGLVADLERRRVDVIVTHAGATVAVVKGARTIPAVYEFSADPVVSGIATDLAHPLYNATGITLLRAELNGKRLEMLRELIPGLRHVGVIANSLHAGEQLELREITASATALGLAISYYATPNSVALDAALVAIAADLPQALLVLSDAFAVEHRSRITAFAMAHRLPIASGWAVMAEAGSVFTLGPRMADSYRRTAYFVDRILKGARPAELPIEQPTVLQTVINMKSARTLGISVAPSLLARADEIIE